MNTTNDITIAQANDEHRPSIIALLQSEKLPVADLPASLDNFFIAVHNNNVIGAIGLEQYGSYGLLRSMVVSKEHRNKKIASDLMRQLERYASILGIGSLYLLTETASQYFDRRGYQRITRDEVPEQLHISSEFSHVCPVSAIVMKKSLS